MKSILLLSLSLCALAVHAEPPTAVRNPFWPIDYAGVSTPISAEIRAKPKPPAPPAKVEKDVPVVSAKVAAAEAAKKKAAAEAAEKAAREAARRNRAITREDWLKARRAVKVSSPATFVAEDGTRRVTVNINGNIYADNDLMSVTHDGIRFTWRIQGLDGTDSIKLARVKARLLEEHEMGAQK